MMTRDVSVSRGTKYFRYFAFDLTLLVYRWGQPRLILIIIMHILDDNIMPKSKYTHFDKIL